MHLVYLLVEVYASNLIRRVLNRAVCAHHSAEENLVCTQLNNSAVIARNEITGSSNGD